MSQTEKIAWVIVATGVSVFLSATGASFVIMALREGL